MNKTRWSWTAAAIIVVLAVVVTLSIRHTSGHAASPGNGGTSQSLMGTGRSGDTDLKVPGAATIAINGSSFDDPLVGATTSGAARYSAGGKVSFSAYPAAGSGTGRSLIASGTLDIGFSDVPMSSAAGTLPSGAVESKFAQVPFALGGAVVGYNLGAGFENLKLTAAEVSAIYNGSITRWSDKAIVATNGAGTKIGKALGALATNNDARDTVKVLYRNAGSGTTEAFTYWLYQAGASGHAPDGGSPMEGSGGAWAATNVNGASNNADMAQSIVSTPGAIGYVEYSYELIPGNAAIQVAQLQDKNGQWLKPSPNNMANAATAAGSSVTPDHFAITNEPGNDVWPLTTYSWAIVLKAQTSRATCEGVTKYLDWESHHGQVTFAAAEGYVPLPTAVQSYARQQLRTITVNGSVCVDQKS